MITSGVTFLVSVTMLVLCVVLWRVEQSREERLLLKKTRALLDAGLRKVSKILHSLLYVWQRYVWQLGWRYVIHVFLRAILISIAGLYERLIRYFEHNRSAAKHIRRDKKIWKQSGHWFELSSHKQHSALSDAEKKARKKAALNGDD